jgi:hypothetical protein
MVMADGGSPPWRSPGTRVSGMTLATRLGVRATRAVQAGRGFPSGAAPRRVTLSERAEVPSTTSGEDAGRRIAPPSRPGRSPSHAAHTLRGVVLEMGLASALRRLPGQRWRTSAFFSSSAAWN